jgi:hypothetical protein
MAGTLQADFLQPQSNTGLFILSPTGSTMATVNTAGIYSSTGAQMLNASGNFGSPTATAITVTGAITGNTVTSNTVTVTGAITGNTVTGNTVVLPGSTSGSVSLVAPAVAGTTTATLPAATGTVMVSGNMPAFSAYRGNSNQSTSAGWNKVQCNVKDFDTANAYDANTNYRFQPTVAGYYQISGTVGTSGTTGELLACIYKNGSEWKRGSDSYSGTNMYSATVSCVTYLNGSTDYVEFYCYTGAGVAFNSSGGMVTWFAGAMIRSA